MRFVIIILILIHLSGCNNRPETVVSYDPPENANYQHEEVEIELENGDILVGSYTFQTNSTKGNPVTILITGSSPHDRDNSKPTMPISAYCPFRQISHLLSSNGISVLRMDDRGIGKSTGGIISKMTTLERASDIEQCISYIKCRPEIDSSKILRKDRNMRFLFDFDPLETIRMINQPVLIIQGQTDRRVPVTDAFIIANELRKAGNENITIHVLPNHNHALLKEDSTGVQTRYGKISSTALSVEVLELILNCVQNEI